MIPDNKDYGSSLGMSTFTDRMAIDLLRRDVEGSAIFLRDTERSVSSSVGIRDSGKMKSLPLMMKSHPSATVMAVKRDLPFVPSLADVCEKAGFITYF